jgi:hypothetical protein
MSVPARLQTEDSRITQCANGVGQHRCDNVIVVRLYLPLLLFLPAFIALEEEAGEPRSCQWSR